MPSSGARARTFHQWGGGIEPLSPARTPRRGRRWRDHRLAIDAVAFTYRTDTPWMDLPDRFRVAERRQYPAA
ncbi:transposase [Streptomyces sp. NPDC046237]|uniref:transposase n=1 Tax=Streptomyces sp. NPDC046237 TaxID=3154914 RepID=UPI0033F3FC26